MAKLLIQKLYVMKTTNEKQQKFDPKTMFITPTGEIKRLSKAGIWMRENPGGILVVNDRRAVNR